MQNRMKRWQRDNRKDRLGIRDGVQMGISGVGGMGSEVPTQKGIADSLTKLCKQLKQLKARAHFFMGQYLYNEEGGIK